MSPEYAHIISTIRISLLIIFCLSSAVGFTQHYRVFRLGLSVGNAKSNLYSFDASVGNKLAFGIRLETYFQNISEKSFSTTTFANYYFNSHIKHLRPYASIGLGKYHISPEGSRSPIVSGSSIIMYEYIRTNMDTKGFFARIGLDYRHVSLMAEYNFIYRREATITYADADFFLLPDRTKHIYLSDNYFTIKIGFYIGNGWRSEDLKQ